MAGAGLMSIIEDPSGAAFCLWQSKSHPGAQLNNAQGTLCWAELHTRNVDACGSFYTRLFDWKPESMNMGDMAYTVFNIDGQANAGMMSMMKNVPDNVPSNWTVYFMVDNCDQTNAKAQALGARIVVPPNDIPGTGRFALYMDPQGASFGILQPVPRM
jgi:predicted enzyme related to lactoylglutathione lyase